MRSLLIISLFFLWATCSWAQNRLLVGDVLLQPLDCWSCNLIEAEEETIYSHIGVVLSVNPVVVAESLGHVKISLLEQFMAKTQKGQQIRVMRFQDESLVNYLQQNHRAFEELYHSHFHALNYDSSFRWDNFDGLGEKLYCSEFVSKLFMRFMNATTPLKAMHFNKNRELWSRFFKGNIPDGEAGNSPEDFHRSSEFVKVFDL